MSKREELERLERRDELPEGSAPAPYHKTYSDAQALEKLAANHGGVQRLSALAALGAKALEILRTIYTPRGLRELVRPGQESIPSDLACAADDLGLLLPQSAAAEEERRGS